MSSDETTKNPVHQETSNITGSSPNQIIAPKSVEAPKKKSKVIWVILIGLGVLLVGFSMLNSLGGPMGLRSMLRGYDDAQSDEVFNKIVESIKPAPAREYTYPTPTSAALARKIDCGEILSYPTGYKAVTPLCLNLYKTSAAEIDSKLASGHYDRVILYGEKLFWDTPASFSGSDRKLGAQIYNSAKFNDGIMLPTLMALYGVKDLSYIPSAISPYPAIYYRLSTLDEIRAICTGDSGAISCATVPWTSTVRESALSDEPLSLMNQKVFSVASDGDGIKYKDRNYIEYDLNHPINCSTEPAVIHETAHNLLWLTGIKSNGIGVANAPKFFNEHQAGLVERMGMDLVCGAETRSNFRGEVDGQSVNYDIPHFSSLYPPASLSSLHPTKTETCKRAILTEWARYLDTENWQAHFASFFSSLRTESATLDLRGDNDFAGFILRLKGNSAATKDFLTSKGCQL